MTSSLSQKNPSSSPILDEMTYVPCPPLQIRQFVPLPLREKKPNETPASDYDAKEEGDQVCKAFFVKKYPPVTADGSIDGFNPLSPSPSPPSFPNLINLVLHLLSPIFLLTYQRAALNKISGAQHLVSRPRPETE